LKPCCSQIVDQGCAGQGLIRFPEPLSTGHQWQLGNLTTQKVWRSRLAKTAQGVFGALRFRLLLLLCSHVWRTIYHPVHLNLKLKAPSWRFPLAACHQVNVAWLTPTMPPSHTQDMFLTFPQPLALWQSSTSCETGFFTSEAGPSEVGAEFVGAFFIWLLPRQCSFSTCSVVSLIEQ